jgi:hypothetical protein
MVGAVPAGSGSSCAASGIVTISKAASSIHNVFMVISLEIRPIKIKNHFSAFNLFALKRKGVT